VIFILLKKIKKINWKINTLYITGLLILAATLAKEY
jgi:hypothetical protein